MFLDSLTIRARNKELRKIQFKSGLNLVVDRTSKAARDSGNNVGKTTFLRAIDFCLGGKKEPIFLDKEFRRKNEKVVKFLSENNVEFELVLKTSSGARHTIKRPFEGDSTIDGEVVEDSTFPQSIQQMLFLTKSGRPTLGELMNKFIRIEEDQISKTLFFLHSSADHSAYEALFLFLFGFRDTAILGKKRKFVDRLKKLKKSLEGKTTTVEDLEQQLFLIEREVTELQQKKDQFKFKEEVDKDLHDLKRLQVEISDIRLTVATLNLKFEMNKEAIHKISESKTSVSTKQISRLYEQAKAELPGLQKKFEEVVKFHNQMVENKLKFLEKINAGLKKKLDLGNKELNGKLSEESKIIEFMSQKGALGTYDELSSKLQEKSRERGLKEGLIQSLKAAHDEITEIEKDLTEVNLAVEKYAGDFSENLKKFNVHFSNFSSRLYGDQYYLSIKRDSNKTTENYLLDIGNLKENIGTGKKKAQISAFDLAYLKFSEEMKLPMPRFVLHDQIETVFENQIETLFDVANSINGQFVVAVLSDKLHNIAEKKVKENTVLELSQDDKFFKIP